MGERGHPGPPGPPGEQGLPGAAGKEGAKVPTNSGHTRQHLHTIKLHIHRSKSSIYWSKPVYIISGLYREIQVLQDPQVKMDLQDSEGSQAREAYQDLW